MPRLASALFHLLLAIASVRGQEGPSTTPQPSIESSGPPGSDVDPQVSLFSPAPPDELVFVDTAAGFAEAVKDPSVGHIVIVAHLDLTGLPPVDTASLALVRPLPSLKSIKGECQPVPPAISKTLPANAAIAEGACVIRVLHAWLDVDPAHGGSSHTLWVSRFVVQAVRPAGDQQEAPLLSIAGGNAWLAGLLLVGDGFQGRGVSITAGDVYIGDAHFSGFRSLSGSAVTSSGGDTTLTLARCSFTGNTADARFGAALLADDGNVLVTNCTFSANGENDIATRVGAVWTPDTDGLTLNVYNSRTRQVTTPTQFDAEEAVFAPEGVAFDDFNADDLLLTPVEAAPVGVGPVAAPAPADLAGSTMLAPAAAPVIAPIADYAEEPPPAATVMVVPGFPTEDDPAIATIRQEQEEAERQTERPQPPPFGREAAPAEDFQGSAAGALLPLSTSLFLAVAAATLLAQ